MQRQKLSGCNLEVLEQQRTKADNELRLKNVLLKNAQGTQQQRLRLVNEVSRLEQRLLDCEKADGAAERDFKKRETELQVGIEHLDVARSAVKVATGQRVQTSRVARTRQAERLLCRDFPASYRHHFGSRQGG